MSASKALVGRLGLRMPWKKARLSGSDTLSSSASFAVGSADGQCHIESVPCDAETPLLSGATRHTDLPAGPACRQECSFGAAEHQAAMPPAHPTSMPEPALADDWGRRYFCGDRAGLLPDCLSDFARGFEGDQGMVVQ